MSPQTPPLPRRSIVVGALVSGAALTAGACSSSATAPAPAGAPSTGTGPGATTNGEGVTPGAATPSPGAPTTAPAPAVLGTPGPDIATGSVTTGAVALTFHGAGDPALTHAVLEVLAARRARVTVFAVGQWLAATPSIGRDVVAAGHALGNHTWSHPTLTHLALPAARDEVRRGADAVSAAVGVAGLLFRPSGTPTSTPTIRAAAAAAGYARCISYDVDSLDYTDPGPDAVVASVAAALHPGAIVSLHLGHAGTVAALPRLLDLLSARHLTAVTVPELLVGAA